MLRNQKHISKAKKLVQNLTLGRQNATPPPQEEANFPPVPLTPPSDPWPLPTDHSFTDPCPLTNDHSFTDPWLSPEPKPFSPEPPPPSLENRNPELEIPLPETDLLINPWPLTTDLCPSDPCLSDTENRKPKTENQLFKGPKPPPPYDETAARADELFEISHGYKRHNPPKPIPNRRRDEDFRSRSIFGDVKNVLKYM